MKESQYDDFFKKEQEYFLKKPSYDKYIKEMTAILPEGINFPTHKEVQDIILNARKSTGFKNFGFRILTTEVPVKEGDKLKNSTQWTYSGEDTGISLGGVSTVGIRSLDKNDIDKSIRGIKDYNSNNSQLILVGGGLAKRGQDTGELIIKDGIVIKVWK